tara:strand:+ start:15890 stop:16498 length:609 start_codon:yes stop_codon:yes gene_type:complete
MAQDIREIMKVKASQEPILPVGHKTRFKARLQANFGSNKNAIQLKKPALFWMKIAALAIAFIAVSMFGYHQLSKNNENDSFVESSPATQPQENEKLMRLADISPDLKRVEEYYMTGINKRLASLKITTDNKDVIDGYMQQLMVLDLEYESLNIELSEVGPSEETITALVDNLKMRLELLMKLKTKLKELKNHTNENISSIEV